LYSVEGIFWGEGGSSWEEPEIIEEWQGRPDYLDSWYSYTAWGDDDVLIRWVEETESGAKSIFNYHGMEDSVITQRGDLVTIEYWPRSILWFAFDDSTMRWNLFQRRFGLTNATAETLITLPPAREPRLLKSCRNLDLIHFDYWFVTWIECENDVDVEVAWHDGYETGCVEVDSVVDLCVTGWLYNNWRMSGIAFTEIVGDSIRLRCVAIDTVNMYNDIPGRLDIAAPSTITLYQPYPNPFNSAVNLQFGIPKTGMVKISVFDILGRQVSDITSQYESGYHSYSFKADPHLVSGLYFIRFSTGDKVKTQKVILLK